MLNSATEPVWSWRCLLIRDDFQDKSSRWALYPDVRDPHIPEIDLEESWRQQPSTPAYCCDCDAEKAREGIRAAVKGKAEKIGDNQWRENYGRLFANKPSQ